MKPILIAVACLALAACRSLGAPATPAALAAYDPQLALEMAQLSDLAYERDRAKLRAALEARGYRLDEHVIEDASTDTSGYIAYNDRVAVVAYTGTERNKADFIQDLKVGRYQRIGEQYCDGQATMHGGFHLPVVRLIDDGSLYATLARHRAAGRSLRFTGHSLGGALATVTAYYASVDRPELRVDQVHTFGQPATGNAAFAECYDATLKDVTYRHVNNLDMVPRLRARPFSGYHHVGTLIYFGRAGHSQAYGTWSVRDIVWDAAQAKSLRDHFLDAYLKVLEQNRNARPLVLSSMASGDEAPARL